MRSGRRGSPFPPEWISPPPETDMDFRRNASVRSDFATRYLNIFFAKLAPKKNKIC